MSGVERRVVVVTGAGRGIGRAYAELFARHGARVVVNDLPSAQAGNAPSHVEEVVEGIREAGGDAVADHHDISTEEGGRSVIARALDEFGQIDVVVNNAGVLRDSAFHKMSADDWTAVRQVHLDGTFHVTRAAWPHLRAQSYGRVIVTTSGSGTFGNFGQANYGAAKLGLVGVINTLAIEGKRYGITANAISPLAATQMTAGMLSSEEYDPAFVAPVVVYLASEECQTTGAVIRAGGGAGGGTISRVAFAVSRGAGFPGIPEVGQVGAAWDSVLDMSETAEGAIALAAD